MKKNLIFLFILFALPALQAGPSVQLRVDVNPKKVTIGDPIDYSLTVVFSSEVASTPLNVTSQLGEFEVIKVSTGYPELQADKIKIHHRLLLTTYSTGTQTIPSIQLQFSVPGGQLAEAQTEPVDITVRSLLEEKGDLGGLRPPKGFFSFRSYFWVWMSLLALILMGGFYWALKHWKQRQHRLLGKPVPAKAPEVLIWEVIQRLEASDWIEKGFIKEYYSDLSTALRLYIENRFSLSILDKTTSELIQECRGHDFTLDQINLIREFLDNGDLVKFAKYSPPSEIIFDDLQRVKKFVTLTTPDKLETSQEKPTEDIPV